MDNLSKTGTENNIYDIRTGKIIEEPILEEKKPDELSEDNFQTFYQKPQYDILPDDNEATLNREGHKFTVQKSSPGLMPEGGNKGFEYLDTDPNLDPAFKRKQQESEEKQRQMLMKQQQAINKQREAKKQAYQKEQAALLRQRNNLIQMDELRKNSKKGEKTIFKIGRAIKQLDKDFFKKNFLIILSVATILGFAAKYGFEIIRDVKINNNTDELTEYAINEYPEFDSYRKAAEYIVDGNPTKEEMEKRLTAETLIEERKKENENSQKVFGMTWHSEPYKSTQQDIADADLTGKIQEVIESGSRGEVRHEGAVLLSKEAGIVKGGGGR